MKNFSITINEEVYPCAMTMGAFLEFKQQTGYDLAKADMTSLSDNATFMWCVIKSSCRREKKQFDLSLQDFCDSVDMLTLGEFQSLLARNMDEYQKKMTMKK